MHSAKAAAARFWLAVTGGGAVPPPNSLHVFSAASNAGPSNVVPFTVSVELPGVLEIEKPAPPPDGPLVGSGKFDTPWERMHSASARADFDSDAGVVPLPVSPVEPQRATASTSITALAAYTSTWSRITGPA